jgi:hypothetical protein
LEKGLTRISHEKCGLRKKNNYKVRVCKGLHIIEAEFLYDIREFSVSPADHFHLGFFYHYPEAVQQ